jgi:hypothetical protein
MSKRDSRIQADGDNPRRQFLGDVGMALAASLLPLCRAGGAASAGGNSYALSDVRHYGVVPNSSAAAAANTAALTELVKPAGSFTGNLTFPNTTGSDVYFFDEMIPLHDGIHIDLMNSTLKFSKTGVARDTNAGFLHALRDFSIENGSIIVDYTHTAGFNTGNALAFGGRGGDCALFPAIWDSLLATPMGKIIVRNVHISSNAGGREGRGILLLGGLDGVLFENVTIDGQGQLFQGIYYEFGWATNEPKMYLRHTSHGRNFRVKNLSIGGVTREGFAANGLYGAEIDGIKVANAGGVCAFGSGSSTFYRVWPGVSGRNSRPNIVIRNAVGESINGVGVGIAGVSSIANGFLDNPPAHDNPNGLTADHQTDLIDFTLDTFSITGTANNYGILSSARRAVIRNGTLIGFQRGVVTTQECTKFLIESVKVLDSTGLGMQLGQPISLHNPPRLSSGIVSRCTVAGSGAARSNAAIALGAAQNCVIESCRFGYDQSHDHKSERTQAQAVLVAADASGVVCRNNYVGGSADNSVAYVLAASGGRQCRLIDNSGMDSAAGAWISGRQGLAVQMIPDSGTIAVSGSRAIWVTASAVVTGVKMQPGVEDRQTVVVVHDGLAANAIEFGVPGESNVAEGARPMAGSTSRILIWDAEIELWHSLNG